MMAKKPFWWDWEEQTRWETCLKPRSVWNTPSHHNQGISSHESQRKNKFRWSSYEIILLCLQNDTTHTMALPGGWGDRCYGIITVLHTGYVAVRQSRISDLYLTFSLLLMALVLYLLAGWRNSPLLTFLPSAAVPLSPMPPAPDDPSIARAPRMWLWTAGCLAGHLLQSSLLVILA